MTGAAEQVVVSVPGSVGNLGPGLDVLGCALTGAHDRVTAQWTDTPGVSIACSGHPQLPTDPERNTVSIAALALLRLVAAKHGTKAAALAQGRGIAMRVIKGLPLSGGQGGSAASAVAGAVACARLLGAKLSPNELMECALEAEAKVAGRHLDNIAPALLGGIVLVRSINPIEVLELRVPSGLHIALATPDQQLATVQARAVLPSQVTRATAVHQMAQVGALVHACHSGDLALLGRCIDDRIAEPARMPLLPGFGEAKRAALDAGALGVSISGAGPTAFAICDSGESAARVADAMRSAYAHAGSSCHTRLCEVDRAGAAVQGSA